MDMGTDTTPLGRLWGYLSAYAVASIDASSIKDAWSKALDCNEAEAALELAILSATLIPSVRRQVEASPNEFVRNSWIKYGPAWCAPLLHQGVHLNQPPGDLPVSDLDVLGLIWTGQVDAGAAEGNSPSPALVETWLQHLRVVREQVRADVQLPPHVRRLVLKRLDQLIEVLGSHDLHGPAGIQSAAAAVIGQLVLHREMIKERSGRTMAALVFGSVVGIYGFCADYIDARDGAFALAHDLGWAIEVIEGQLAEQEPGQLPPAKTENADQQAQDDPESDESGV